MTKQRSKLPPRPDGIVLIVDGGRTAVAILKVIEQLNRHQGTKPERGLIVVDDLD